MYRYVIWLLLFELDVRFPSTPSYDLRKTPKSTHDRLLEKSQKLVLR